MLKTICLAQTVEELKFLLSKKKIQDIFVVPLDLKVQLYCKQNSINYINPINYLDNSFHKRGLIESDKLISKIKYKNFKYQSEILKVEAFIRFHFNSIFFLKSLLVNVFKKNKIEQIIVSGWNKYEKEYSEYNYFISNIVKNFFPEKKIIFLSHFNKNKFFNKIIDYDLDSLKLKKNNDSILLTNLGYNFIKIVKFLKNSNYILLTPDKKINFFIKFILKYYFRVHFFKFRQNLQSNKLKKQLPEIKLNYKDKLLSKILLNRFEEEKYNLINLRNKFLAINNLYKKINLKLVFSNNVRGEDGFYLEIAKKFKVPSVCIPHGTLSKYYNKYDKIYKQIIADAVIFTKATYIASQSLIAKKFFDQKPFYKKKILNSGNLIFTETKNKNINKNLLFAVTLKNFWNLQFLGVEMYYEFLDNLEFLNNFSNKHKYNIFVKPHPAAESAIPDLQENYPNLYFTNKKLSSLLKNIKITLSFSSTVIEDSLNSSIPVILLDRRNRYVHCDAEKNFLKKNCPIYYVTNENSLSECIKTINNSNKIRFDKSFITSSKKNFKKIFRMLKK